jgi:predicted Rossmann fold flavoprotein
MDLYVMQILVIGGGAAGFFAAINCAELYPKSKVTLLEKSGKLLTKVRVSGGGRCNVTHHCHDHTALVKSYPRGEKQLLAAFSRFAVADVVEWFEKRGVKLKVEDDGRMFPVTDSSATIANCFLKEAEQRGVVIRMHAGVKKVVPGETGGYRVILDSGEALEADKVIIATGGNPRPDAYRWLSELGHIIVDPVPSLFTFNIPDDLVTGLMGVAVNEARIKIAGTKLEAEGPLLITHWGMSGPAVLKLSSLGARKLHELQYHFNIQVSWLPAVKEEELRLRVESYRKQNASSAVHSSRSEGLPKRLWSFLVQKSGAGEGIRWGDLSNKQASRLVAALLHDKYEVKGKTTFKEEFVTCGGVHLDGVDFRTMESRALKGIFFAGEVLDIDGITGGFNFQSAWTTAMIAARNVGN